MIDHHLMKEDFKSLISHIDSKNRHIGIAYTIFGWFIIAFSTIFFCPTRATHSLVNTCFHHYLAAFMTVSLWAGFKSKKNFFCKNPFLVVLNSFLCMICYYIYFILKAAPASISNSYFLNFDPIIVALAYVLVLGKKIRPLSWVGLVIGFIGIVGLFSFHVDFSNSKAISDALLCVLSAAALAVLILFTKFLLQNNPPVVLALSHCLVGLFCSGVMVLFTGWEPPTRFDLFCMGMDGFMYALSLYFFINALYYTEVYITMSMSYLLPVYLILISLGMGQGGMNQYMALGMLLILVGVIITPLSVYIKAKQKEPMHFLEDQMSVG